MEPGKKDSVTHIHQIYIRASAQAIWDAITSPEWNGKYGYQAVSEYDLRPGGKYRAKANARFLEFGLPEIIIDGAHNPAGARALASDAAVPSRELKAKARTIIYA